jgi:hypothetical protein
MDNGASVGTLSAMPAHTVRETFRAGTNLERQFGPPGRIRPDFCATLLERGVSYDPELAYALSIVSGWSYSDGRTLARQLKYYGLPGASVEEIAVINPAMYIVATAMLVRSACGRIAILAFRGTEPTNLISWLTDADVNLRDFAGTGAVHRGFYTNLQAVWEDVEAALEQAMSAAGCAGNDGQPARAPIERLFLTGHSLGGAMALLAAAKICRDEARDMRRAVQGIYTFGQPAVGDEQFAAHQAALFGDRLYRHEYAYDAVPRLPPQSLGKFVHFGEARVAFSSKEGWQKSAAMRRQAHLLAPTALSIFASFVGRRTRLLGTLECLLCKYSLFDDHSPARYIDTSRAALGD